MKKRKKEGEKPALESNEHRPHINRPNYKKGCSETVSTFLPKEKKQSHKKD